MIIDEKKIEELISSTDKILLVDFFASWCGPCKALSPILEEVESELSDKLEVVKINIDENNDLTEKYGIMSVPTCLLFKNGKLANTFVGLKSKNEIIEIINKLY